MKQVILKNKKALGGMFAILLVGAVTMSFQDSPFTHTRFSVQDEFLGTGGCGDTLPGQKTMTLKDLDKLQAELDKTLLTVTRQLEKMDFSKMKQDIEKALTEVNLEKIQLDVDRALKSIDLDKMQAEMRTSLREIDLNYKETEIEKAFAEARKEMEKAKKELKDIDRKAIRKEIEKAKSDIEKAKREIDNIDIDKIKTEVNAEISKAKTELKQTRDMLSEMEKEGLISSKNGFTIEYKNKDLYIDGKKQPKNTSDKYRRYFRGEHFKLKIDKDRE